MANVVGLSGAQGAGKSTLLSGLKERGWATDDFKVSRFVQAKMGFVSLEEAIASPEVMKAFQEEVFHEKWKHDDALRRSTDHELILVERTFSDICTYSHRWSWDIIADSGKWPKFDIHAAISWTSSMSHNCVHAQKLYASILLLPYMKHMVWEDDRRRASRNLVDSVYEEIERFQDRRELISQPKFRITAESVEDRIDQVDAYLRTVKAWN